MAIEDTEHSTAGTRPRQPDKHHGQRDFLLLDNWIFSVDQYFILTDMSVQKQGPFVSTLLRDETLLWYCSSYEKWDPKTPLRWEIIRTAMSEYFAPPMRIVAFRTSGQVSDSTEQSSNMCQF